MERRQLKACGVLIVRGKPINSFLLMVHSNRLDLPKGHINPGETEHGCALRELWEETGIQDTDIELDPTFRFQTSYQVRPAYLGGELCDKTTVIFLGRLLRDVSIVLSEHPGYRWYDWAPPHQIQKETIDPLLAHLEHHLASDGEA